MAAVKEHTLMEFGGAWCVCKEAGACAKVRVGPLRTVPGMVAGGIACGGAL